MEKDIHNDRLEDYVKKSFMDYEETPPGDMWSRVEADLPPGEPARRPLARLYDFKWQTAAAAVILLLLSRLLFVQSYYEQQLRSMASQNQTRSYGNQSAGADHPASDETAIPPSLTNGKQTSEKISKASDIHATTAVQAAGRKYISYEGSGESSYNFLNGAAMGQDTTSLADGNTVQHIFNQPAGFFSDFPLLPVPEPGVITASNHVSIPSAALLPIKPVGSGRKWYVLAGIAPGRVAEKRMPLRPGGPRPVFASRSEAPETITSFSLRLGRAINRKLAVEGGLAYQEMSRQTIHRPLFQFREGQMIPGGGGHHQQARSFQYNLNTYGGSASVTLRADVVGSNIPGENERVEAEIMGNERIQLLQIPLTAVARLGKGPVQGVVRAGVVGNYMLKNNFEITTWQLDNPELQLQADNGYTVEFHKPRRFFPGYQVALGAEYRISEKLSVSAFPVITGDFPRKDIFRGGNLPGQTTLGVTVAAACWF